MKSISTIKPANTENTECTIVKAHGFSCSGHRGGTIHTFHLHNLPREIKLQCTFNKWTMYGAVGVNTNSPHTKHMGHTKNITKKSFLLLNVVMEKQFTHFICIIYPGKHNGTIFLDTQSSCNCPRLETTIE